MAREQRRLAAIAALDVVGYSRLMGRDESGTLGRLKEHRRERLEPTLARYGGRLVKLTGDGALVEFASAVDALGAAIEFQQAMTESNWDQPEDAAIVFRIGLHLGDLIVDGDDLYGDGVNVAARLEAEAPPGGIVVSSAVHDAVANKLKASFRDLGDLNLRNIERPVRAFQAEWDPADWPSRGAEPRHFVPRAAAVSKTGLSAIALPNRPSIAVLPFTNMSGDHEQEYFADGIAEDIITGLSRVKWLFVIARNSSFTYKGRAVDLKQVSSELGVRYVLEGSVRRSGNRVRVTGQLIDAETGAHLWAERYDRPLDDIFAVQDEITINVVGAIEPSLRRAEIDRAKRKRPDNLDAYDFVLKALPLVYTAMPDDSAKAIPLLEQALALEPGYANAEAMLAWCLHQRFARAGLREDDRRAVVRYARAAVVHGGDDPTALAMAAFVTWLDEGDTATACKLFDRALALSNCNVYALGSSAVALAWMGQLELAIQRAESALRFSPFDALNYLPYCALANAFFSQKRYEASAEAARNALEVNPRFSVAQAYLAAALVRLGRTDEAKVAADAVLGLEPSFTIRGFSATVGHMPEVFSAFANAWRDVGLPD